MTAITIHFEVPKFIETGLVNGSMERIGGVVRNPQSESNEVIAWMRQIGQVGQTVESSGELIENVMRSAGLSAATTLNLLTTIMPLVNIAMAGYSLLDIISDIRSQRREIERIYARIEEEFWQDRMANLVAALELGERLHVVENLAFAYELVGEITDSLLETKEHFRVDFDDLLKSAEFSDNIESALRFHAASMLVVAMVVRSWLQIGERRLALEWLRSVMRAQKERTRRLVRKLLGSPSALYFHESVSEEYFDRFLSIEGWLRGKRDILRDLIHDSRKRFWDEGAVDDLFVLVPVNRKELSNNPFYVGSLPLAEIAIENYQRLEGFEHELKSMSSSLEEWEAIGRDQIGEYSGYILLVDDTLVE